LTTLGAISNSNGRQQKRSVAHGYGQSKLVHEKNQCDVTPSTSEAPHELCRRVFLQRHWHESRLAALWVSRRWRRKAQSSSRTGRDGGIGAIPQDLQTGKPTVVEGVAVPKTRGTIKTSYCTEITIDDSRSDSRVTKGEEKGSPDFEKPWRGVSDPFRVKKQESKGQPRTSWKIMYQRGSPSQNCKHYRASLSKMTRNRGNIQGSLLSSSCQLFFPRPRGTLMPKRVVRTHGEELPRAMGTSIGCEASRTAIWQGLIFVEREGHGLATPACTVRD
jgi:hypothetical protein